MATQETCPEYKNCGFAIYLNKMGETANCDCKKNPSTCGRLNPIVPIEICAKGAVTRDEIEIAFPILYESDDGKPRRIIRGTHR